MAKKYVDVELVKEALLGWDEDPSDEDLEYAIDDIPTANVAEVKHGHFVRNERNIPKMKEFHEKGFALSMNTKSIFWTCSCCGSWASLTQKYCSECGAKMDGGKTDVSM